MPAAQKVVTIDLGASTLKFGEFAIGRGGALTLLRYGITEIGLDPNKEESRAKFITPTLAKMLKDQNIRAKEALLSISGQSVFMRFVKLPAINTTQVEQVVEFEAKQNVPFPIDEVTWDYQMMPNRSMTAGTDAEAVIVAIKKDILEAEVEAVEKAGVKVKRVDVAPFALLNAFRYSEPQTDDCSLIIDMGARSTNLVFVEKSSFWIRNIPIAGNQISQNICNELQEPFTAAETLKRGKGFVSLGGVYADPDDADAARISKIIRSTMTRLHVDINRSIAYYRTTLNGGPPKRIFLSGGSSQLPYLDLFIADKLSLPVAYFNPLRNVSLAPSLNRDSLQQSNCCTAELVGLALRETGSCPAEVSLEAPTLAARSDKRRKQPYYYCALMLWAILFVCLSLSYWQQINLAAKTAATLRSQTVGLKHNASTVQRLAAQADALGEVRDAVTNLGEDRNRWPQILSALNDKIPPGVWITEMTPSYESARPAGNGNGRRGGGGGRGGNNFNGNNNGPQGGGGEINMLVITGLYHANAKTMQVDSTSLGAFVNSLATLPYFDINTSRTSETLISFTTPDTDPGSFAQKFTMHLRLRRPIAARL
ncbi:MAG TPA: type IV pilus assembly protein PilM [Candidatus Methylacidiphilales bacterium]|nr:type IV pilus assembly protein PilM [Candidatus Methylacidiphilales bacterium]